MHEQFAVTYRQHKLRVGLPYTHLNAWGDRAETFVIVLLLKGWFLADTKSTQSIPVYLPR